MSQTRRLLAPTTLICALALALALVLATTAAAETRSGEATRPADGAIPAEADTIKAAATYDSTAGTMSFTITTAAEPEGKPSEDEVVGGLFHVSGGCTFEAVESGGEGAAAEVVSEYAKEVALGFFSAHRNAETKEIPATKSVAGATTTLSATSSILVNQAFNCALVGVAVEGGYEEERAFLVFPIAAPPVAPVAPTPTPEAAVPPAPAPALSIAKGKQLNLKAGRWQKVNVKISNPGAVAAGPITIKLTAPAGVQLQPASGTLKLPALLAGQSWNVTFEVKLTAKAKKRSTISVSGAGPGISAKSSFVVKLLGG
jgi:hypothetical protein